MCFMENINPFGRGLGGLEPPVRELNPRPTCKAYMKLGGSEYIIEYQLVMALPPSPRYTHSFSGGHAQPRFLLL